MMRNQIIEKYVENKRILDLGFLGENKNTNFSNLHKFLIKKAKKVTGVDIDKKRIEKLKKKYNVICDDVQKLNNVKRKKESYEVIVAGELIEHLENPGLFLKNIKDLMNEKTILIVTTPNMLSLRFIGRHILFGQENPFWKDRNAEIKYGHVNGFSKSLLRNLLKREGFEIIEEKYTIKNEYSGIKGKIEKIISKTIPKLSPSLITITKLKSIK